MDDNRESGAEPTTDGHARGLTLRRALLLAAVAAWCTSLAMGVASPEFEGVDEPAHLGYAASLAGGRLPEIADPLPRTPIAQLGHLIDAYEARGGAPGNRGTVWVANHPPAYYVASLPAVAIGGRLDPDRGPLLGLRMMSATCMAGAVLVVGALARRLVSGQPVVALGAATLFAATAAVPSLGGLAYSDSAGTLMWLAGLTVAVDLVRRPVGSVGPTQVVVSAAVGVLAATTRASALVAAAAIVAGWCVLAFRSRAVEPSSARHWPRWGLVAAMAAPVLVAGPFYLRNVRLYGSPTAEGYLLERFDRSARAPVVEQLTSSDFHRRWIEGLWSGLRPQVVVTGVLWWLLAIGVVAVAAAFWSLRWQPARWDPLGALAWALVALASVTVVVTVASFTSKGGNPHPRYLLPLAGVLAVAVSAGLARGARPDRPPVLLAGVVGLAVVAQGWMLLGYLDLLGERTSSVLLPAATWAQTVAHGLVGVAAVAAGTAVLSMVRPGAAQRLVAAGSESASGPPADHQR